MHVALDTIYAKKEINLLLLSVNVINIIRAKAEYQSTWTGQYIITNIIFKTI